MKRILLFIFLASQIINGQSKIQHEPERLFMDLFPGDSVSRFVKKNRIEKITFLRDTILSSSIEFDRNGNSIVEIGMENNYVRTTLRKYDNLNREIETKYFNTDGSFRYGYYYKFIDGSEIMYKLEDSLLYRKSAFIAPENIKLYSEYNKDGNLILKNVNVYDDDMRYLLTNRFQNDRLYVQFRYEYLDNKKYVTKIQFDENGTKVSERRLLDEEKFPDDKKLIYYTEDEQTIFRIDKFDENENLLKMELFNENQLIRTKTNSYNSKGQITNIVEENFQREEKIEYTFRYNELDQLKSIKKATNGIAEIFYYDYIMAE